MFLLLSTIRFDRVDGSQAKRRTYASRSGAPYFRDKLVDAKLQSVITLPAVARTRAPSVVSDSSTTRLSPALAKRERRREFP